MKLHYLLGYWPEEQFLHRKILPGEDNTLVTYVEKRQSQIFIFFYIVRELHSYGGYF